MYSTLAWADSWFSVSDTGTLAYVPGDPTPGRLAWLERDGRTTTVSDAVVSLADPSLSPDGERIAFEDRDDNLWAQDLRRATRVRLTLDGEGSNAYPVWSRDGTRVLFASNRSGDGEIWSAPRPAASRSGSSRGRRTSFPPPWLQTGQSCSGVLTVGDSRRLFDARAAAGRSTLQAGYSVSPDWRRFLVLLLDPRAIPTQINVVQNWFEELKAKVPVR